MKHREQDSAAGATGAWRERRRLSPALGIKAWALASIFRTAEALGAREDGRSRTMTEFLPEEVEPDPLYEDDEDFWQSHELEYPKNAEVFSGTVDRAREDVAKKQVGRGSLDEIGALHPARHFAGKRQHRGMVATSPYSSHRSCAARRRAVICKLSSRNSASMSSGVT